MIPLFSVENGTEFCHSIYIFPFPLCSGLLESRPDQVFAGSFHLAASNRQARCQPFPVIHPVRMEHQVIFQDPKNFLIRIQLFPLGHRPYPIQKGNRTSCQQIVPHGVKPPLKFRRSLAEQGVPL